MKSFAFIYFGKFSYAIYCMPYFFSCVNYFKPVGLNSKINFFCIYTMVVKTTSRDFDMEEEIFNFKLENLPEPVPLITESCPRMTSKTLVKKPYFFLYIFYIIIWNKCLSRQTKTHKTRDKPMVTFYYPLKAKGN